jgi:hypothetical protein
MPVRRTVAPDIVGCAFMLYAATLAFAVLRAPYAHRDIESIAVDIAAYGGLLLVCVVLAVGLFLRRSFALWPAVLLSLGAIAAGYFGWHVPETAQLPAGVLGAVGAVLLLFRRAELAPAGSDSDDSDEPESHGDGEARTP